MLSRNVPCPTCDEVSSVNHIDPGDRFTARYGHYHWTCPRCGHPATTRLADAGGSPPRQTDIPALLVALT